MRDKISVEIYADGKQMFEVSRKINISFPLKY